MTPPSYIIVPAGELLGPYWQAIMRLSEGYKIVCVALQLRDMAVLCNAGGAICHPSGKPLSTAELAAVLGVDFIWLEPVLRGVLAPAGLISQLREGGWACTDPTTQRHFLRLCAPKERNQQPPELILEEEPEYETKSERHMRLGRNRQLTHKYKKKWGVEPGEVRYLLRDRSVTPALPESVTPPVTPEPQHSDITSENGALLNSTVLEGITPSSYKDNDDASRHKTLTLLLRDFPLHDQAKLAARIQKCREVGHSLRSCQLALDDAIKGSQTSQIPAIALALTKLADLAAVSTSKPTQKEESKTEVRNPDDPPPGGPRPDPTPEGRAALASFEQMFS